MWPRNDVKAHFAAAKPKRVPHWRVGGLFVLLSVGVLTLLWIYFSLASLPLSEVDSSKSGHSTPPPQPAFRKLPMPPATPAVHRDSRIADHALHGSVCDLEGDTVQILCVGDSITYGNGSHVRRKERDHEGNFPLTLERALRNDCHGKKKDVVVWNLGHSGRTLVDGYKQSYRNSSLYRQMQSLAPASHVVILMLGTNDSKQRHWRGKAVFEEALRTFIAELTRYRRSLYVILVTPPPAFPHPRLLRRGKTISESMLGGIRRRIIGNDIRMAVMSVAEQTSSDLVDLFGEFLTLDAVSADIMARDVDTGRLLCTYETLFHDGVHPSEAGHDFIAQVLRRMLVKRSVE